MKFIECEESFHVKKNSSRRNLKISGYANVFFQEDSYGDIVEKGAFLRSLKNPKFRNIKLLWQHDEKEPIGIITKIVEDEYGLYIEGDVNSYTQSGKDAIALIIQGAVSGLSIGFNIVDSYINNNGNRVIKEVDLWEVSIVTFPANNSSFITNHSINNNSEEGILVGDDNIFTKSLSDINLQENYNFLHKNEEDKFLFSIDKNTNLPLKISEKNKSFFEDLKNKKILDTAKTLSLNEEINAQNFKVEIEKSFDNAIFHISNLVKLIKK